MSEIRTRRIFNGLPVDEYTDINTGQIEVRSANFLGVKGDLLAISTGKNWKIQDSSGFLRRYNNVQRNQNKPVLTQKEFEKLFNTKGIGLFNNDRAAVLNSNSSEDNRRQFVVKNIPGIKDPTDGTEVNSEGEKTTERITGEEEQTEDPDSVTPVAQTNTSTTDTSTTDASPSIDNTAERGNDTTELLKYPEYDLSRFGYDYIKIQRFKYRPRASIENGRINPLLTGGDSKRRLGSALERIFLPMQPQLSESNSVDWGGDRLNEIQSRLGNVALGGIYDISNSGGFNGFIDALKNVFTGVGNVADDFLKDPGTKYAVAAYFAGQAVGANILSRATGQVLNPNLELLFNGPRLRTFSFNFTFTPRNDDEAKTIKKIIRVFKTGMAPATSTSNLFLYTPDIFKLEYIYNATDQEGKSGEPHPYMNQIKPCALTNFSVNYTPSNVYMTYKTGSMTQYTVQMQFSELEPIYQKDQLTSKGTGF